MSYYVLMFFWFWDYAPTKDTFYLIRTSELWGAFLFINLSINLFM